MSNLNDFIGNSGISHHRSNGISTNTTFGLNDDDSQIEVSGTTADTHIYGREFKLYNVPEKRVYSDSTDGISGTWTQPFLIKIDPDTNTTNAPNPAESATHPDNFIPTTQAFLRCLTYKIYTKQNAADSYNLKDSLDFSSMNVDASEFTSSSGVNTEYVSGSEPDVYHRIRFDIRYLDSTSTASTPQWQEATTQQRSWIRAYPRMSRLANLDECMMLASSTGPLFVKLQWEVDATAYSNLFSRSYNEVEGFRLINYNGNVMTALYSGQRQYTDSRHTVGDYK